MAWTDRHWTPRDTIRENNPRLSLTPITASAFPVENVKSTFLAHASSQAFSFPWNSTISDPYPGNQQHLYHSLYGLAHQEPTAFLPVLDLHR